MDADTTLPEISAEWRDKWADTVPAVHPLMRKRWSPRTFLDRDVSNADLTAILEAARWAASSNNEQPWRFFVARKSDGAAFGEFLSLLVPSNQAWAKTAPVLMITAAKKTFSYNGKDNYYALHDTGAALAQLFLQANALGLHAHGMGGFDRERAREQLALPDDYWVGAAVAVGYAAPPAGLPEKDLAKRQRKPLSEIVRGRNWDTPLEL